MTVTGGTTVEGEAIPPIGMTQNGTVTRDTTIATDGDDTDYSIR
jgi:hypothetical protein